MTMDETPGTWRDDDPPIAVAWTEAIAAWTEAAVPILETVASHYTGSVTYEQLAEQLFETTGVRTKMLLSNWIGKVLGPVQGTTLAEDKPPLTSLVVTADGAVGKGYINHAHRHGFTADFERQEAAASDRLECYRVYCDHVPEDARPHMTALYLAKHTRQPKAVVQPKICPTCSMMLPVSGQCDDCF